MRILIIRHGDPDYANDSLTEKGRREAEQLSKRLAGEQLDYIYCSPLGRAQATAAPTVRVTGLQPETKEWLREFPANIKTDYRPDGMCPWEMLPRHWSSIPALYDRKQWKSAPPFAESRVPEVYDRVCGEFDKLIAEHGYTREGQVYAADRPNDETLAFFCHQGLGLTLVSHIIGLSLPQVWQTMFLPTSSVTLFHMEEHREEPGSALLRCIYLGDISHLYRADG